MKNINHELPEIHRKSPVIFPFFEGFTMGSLKVGPLEVIFLDFLIWLKWAHFKKNIGPNPATFPILEWVTLDP